MLLLQPRFGIGANGGNLVMASPVGDLTLFFLDLTLFFLALGASVELNDGQNQRTVPLKNFFLLSIFL